MNDNVSVKDNAQQTQSKWEQIASQEAKEGTTEPEVTTAHSQSDAVQLEDQDQGETKEPLESLKERLALTEQRLVVAEQEKEEFLKQIHYAEATLQNTRRNALRDIEKARRYAGEAVVEAFLPIADSYELSLAQSTTFEQLREGSEQISKLMSSTLEKLGVKPIMPEVGEALNPYLHEAMSTEVSQQSPNTVIRVLQKGYQLHERVIRPALVVVSQEA